MVLSSPGNIKCTICNKTLISILVIVFFPYFVFCIFPFLCCLAFITHVCCIFNKIIVIVYRPNRNPSSGVHNCYFLVTVPNCYFPAVICSFLSATHTHTHTQPFYGSVEFDRENPGELVPEETFTHYSHRSHQSSLSAFSI